MGTNTVEVPKNIAATLQALSPEAIKRHVITKNGMTVAEEKEILQALQNPEITATLETEEEIEAYYNQFIDDPE